MNWQNDGVPATNKNILTITLMTIMVELCVLLQEALL